VSLPPLIVGTRHCRVLYIIPMQPETISGNVYPLPDAAAGQMREQLRVERQRAEVQQQRAERLAEYLRSQGIDPDNLPES